MNCKENPRNSTITFRLTAQEKQELEKIARKQTGGKVSQLVWKICLEYIKKEEQKDAE